MAFKCGFFNAKNGDRKYNADDVMNPIKGIVSDGIVADDIYSDGLQVQAYEGLEVVVKKGYGKFHNKWCELDADMIITVPTPHVTETRIDSIVIKIDTSDSIRNGFLEYRQGTTVAPELERNESVMEYRLANITVAPNVTEITQANIQDTRPTSECGFVTNLLQNSDISATYSQWQAQFVEWFNNVKETLSTNTLIRSFTSRYVTSEQDETIIPINIPEYKSVLDILQVYINGLICVENIEYTIDDFNNVILTNGVDAGTEIAFIVYKSMDGTGIDKFIEDVDDLIEQQTSLDARLTNTATKATTNATNISNLTTKVNTNTTNISNLTTKVNTATTNITSLDSRVNKLETVTYSPLWEGANTMGASASITPSKKLDECRNGWLLVWSGYNTSTNKATETRLQFTYVPKNLMANLTVESMPIYANLIYTYYESGNFDTTAKLVTITDEKITGFAGNVATDFGKGICLMAVMEW